MQHLFEASAGATCNTKNENSTLHMGRNNITEQSKMSGILSQGMRYVQHFTSKVKNF